MVAKEFAQRGALAEVCHERVEAVGEENSGNVAHGSQVLVDEPIFLLTRLRERVSKAFLFVGAVGEELAELVATGFHQSFERLIRGDVFEKRGGMLGIRSIVNCG